MVLYRSISALYFLSATLFSKRLQWPSKIHIGQPLFHTGHYKIGKKVGMHNIGVLSIFSMLESNKQLMKLYYNGSTLKAENNYTSTINQSLPFFPDKYSGNFNI